MLFFHAYKGRDLCQRLNLENPIENGKINKGESLEHRVSYPTWYNVKFCENAVGSSKKLK